MIGWPTRSISRSVGKAGFGQSLRDDFRFRRRFRQCRHQAVKWRLPSEEEGVAIESHRVLGRFGDTTIGIADVEGRRWIVRDRDWFGWPDPPEFVLFVLEGETIWAAKDFDHWPSAWQRP